LLASTGDHATAITGWWISGYDLSVCVGLMGARNMD